MLTMQFMCRMLKCSCVLPASRQNVHFATTIISLKWLAVCAASDQAAGHRAASGAGLAPSRQGKPAAHSALAARVKLEFERLMAGGGMTPNQAAAEALKRATNS
jgi:hypothetical protein